MSNTQLTNPSNYDVDRMVFSKPQMGSIPGTTVKFQRIMISTKNQDGTTGDLILEAPTRLFSFGVRPNTSMDGSDAIIGYSLPLCLLDRESPTEEQQTFYDTFNRIIEHCKEHIVEHKDDIGQEDLVMSDLRKLNPISIRKDRDTKKEYAPVLFLKMMYDKNRNRILSTFYNTDGDEIDPLDYMGGYLYATAAIKIDNIFIGSRISIQVKLYEAEIEQVQQKRTRLLRSPKPRKLVEDEDEDDDKDKDDIKQGEGEPEPKVEEEEEEDEEAPKPKKKLVRRRKK